MKKYVPSKNQSDFFWEKFVTFKGKQCETQCSWTRKMNFNSMPWSTNKSRNRCCCCGCSGSSGRCRCSCCSSCCPCCCRCCFLTFYFLRSDF